MKAHSGFVRLVATSLLLAGLAWPQEIPSGVQRSDLPNGIVRYDKVVEKSSPFGFWWQRLYELFQWKPTSTPPFRKSVAFLVGVSKYDHLQELRWVRNDLKTLRNFLLTDGGFDTVLELHEEAVRRDVIEDYLFNQFASDGELLGREDRLLFFYSGHGADQQGQIGYLQFKGAVPGNFAGGNVMPVREFADWARVSVAKHLLVILDSCASGLAVQSKGNVNPQALLRSLSGEGSGFLMTAGRADQKAFEIQVNSEQGYSVLTHALLEALQDGKADPDNTGFLTINQVYSQVQLRLKAYQAMEGKKMDPQLWPLNRSTGELDGTFVFLDNKARNPVLPQSYQGRRMLAKIGAAGIDDGESFPTPVEKTQEETSALVDQPPHAHAEEEPAIKTTAVLKKPRIAVLDLDYRTVRSEVEALWGTDQDIGREISELLVQKLVQDGKYYVMERRALSQGLAKQNLSNNYRSDASFAAQIGRTFGIDAVVIGSIEDFGRENQRAWAQGHDDLTPRFGIGGISKRESKAVCKISARLVDVVSGNVLAEIIATGESKHAGTSIAGSSRNDLSMSSRDFTRSLLGEAVGQAVASTGNQLSDASLKLTTHKAAVDHVAVTAGTQLSDASLRPATRKAEISGLVSDVSGDTLILNIGSKAGLRAGDKLEVSRPLRTVKDPATGKVLRTITSKVGEARVTQLNGDSSIATYVGSGPAKVGDVAKTSQ